MAMLAEPRRKQRIGPNPRGKFFMEDDCNSGKQLLQKMGWKQGDGLGLQKQGMVEPVKPKVQMTNKGVGYTIKNDPWIEHSTDFADVLRKLNEDNSNGGSVLENEVTGNDDDLVETNKLENKSKSSRARIHYHKFVKGKDLSRASSKDLESIFGTNYKEDHSSLKDSPCFSSDNSLQEVNDVVEPDADSKTINRGSMHDYFAKKMERMRKKLSQGIIEPKEVEEGFEETQHSSKPKKDKKRKRSVSPELESITESNVGVEDLEETKNPVRLKKDKKWKRAASPEPESMIESKVVKEDFDETTNACKPKKNKRLGREASPETIDKLSNDVVVEAKLDSKFVNKGSMHDYFAQKMEQKKLKQEMDEPKVDEELELPKDPSRLKKDKKRKKAASPDPESIEEPKVAKNFDKPENVSKPKKDKKTRSAASPEVESMEEPKVAEDLELTKKLSKPKKDKKRKIAAFPDRESIEELKVAEDFDKLKNESNPKKDKKTRSVASPPPETESMVVAEVLEKTQNLRKAKKDKKRQKEVSPEPESINEPIAKVVEQDVEEIENPNKPKKDKKRRKAVSADPMDEPEMIEENFDTPKNQSKPKKDKKQRREASAEPESIDKDKPINDIVGEAEQGSKFINKGSMLDYFAQKMEQKKLQQELDEPKEVKEGIDIEEPENPSTQRKDNKRRRAASPESIKKLSKEFKGSNLNKINGYALY